MTRTQIEATYRVRNGRIVSPGRFERERVYMPAMHLAWLDGWADQRPGGVWRVEITPSDRNQFPELRRKRYVRFVIGDNGFVTEL